MLVTGEPNGASAQQERRLSSLDFETRIAAGFPTIDTETWMLTDKQLTGRVVDAFKTKAWAEAACATLVAVVQDREAGRGVQIAAPKRHQPGSPIEKDLSLKLTTHRSSGGKHPGAGQATA